MKARKFTNELCRREGLKKQTDIAQMSEIVGRMAEIIAEINPYDAQELFESLIKLGEKRLKKKA